jgi:hypothetical protein
MTFTALAILDQRSAHSLPMGPSDSRTYKNTSICQCLKHIQGPPRQCLKGMALILPSISPLGFTITPALSVNKELD